MLSMKLLLLFIAGCVLSVVAAPPLGRMTNAQRFAQGLPPMRPRKLFDMASPIDTAARAKRSVATGFSFSCGTDTALCCTTVNNDGSVSGCTDNTRNTHSDICYYDDETAVCCTGSFVGSSPAITSSGCTPQ